MTMSNSQNARNWKNSVTGILDIGWGHQCNETFYLGINAFVNFAKRNSTITNFAGFTYFAPFTQPPVQVNTLSTSNETKLNNTEYGIDLIPGALLGPMTLFYFRVGAAFNKIRLANNNTLLVLYPNRPGSPSSISQLNVASDKNLSGLRLGIGIEKYLCNNVTLSLDYVNTRYSRISVSGIGNVQSINIDEGIPVTELNAFTTNGEATLTSNQVYLGLKYRFC